jgi:hypothetical protein
MARDRYPDRRISAGGDRQITLPRPRDIASPEFNAWRRLLVSQLHSHHARKAG